MSEQERIVDRLKKNELFETDKFNKDFCKRNDLHRQTKKDGWISPKGFALTSTNKRGDSVPISKRHSIMNDVFWSTMQSFNS